MYKFFNSRSKSAGTNSEKTCNVIKKYITAFQAAFKAETL